MNQGIPSRDELAANSRELDKLHVGNRFRLMFGMPLLPEKMNTEIDDERMAEWNELRDLVRIAGSLDCGSGIAGKIQKLERMADRVARDDLRNYRPSLLFIIGEMLKEKYQEREQL